MTRADRATFYLLWLATKNRNNNHYYVMRIIQEASQRAAGRNPRESIDNCVTGVAANKRGSLKDEVHMLLLSAGG